MTVDLIFAIIAIVLFILAASKTVDRVDCIALGLAALTVVIAF